MINIIVLGMLLLGIIFLVIGLIMYIKRKDSPSYIIAGGVLILGYIFIKLLDKIM